MTVAKIGGRIVSAQALPALLRCVLDRPSRPMLLIAGGGEAADLVRRWDRGLALDAVQAHWLAIRAMSLQAELLGRRLCLPVIRRLEDAQNLDVSVLDLFDGLAAAPGDVPASWDVTSDSLAAWAARKVGASRLIMVKSVGTPETTVEEAVVAGWLDPHFSAVARGLDVEWFNVARLHHA